MHAVRIMRRTVDSRLTLVVNAVHDLVQETHAAFPFRPLQPLFAQLFDAEPAWNWVDSPTEFGFTLLNERQGWPPESTCEMWRAEGMARHPLWRWYATTRDPAPMSMARVPTAVASAADQQFIRSDLSGYGLEEQLGIPCQIRPGRQVFPVAHAFVIARGGYDFADADVELAIRIQPLLMLLYLQVEVLVGSVPAEAQLTNGCLLTGRELAVLTLLADGLTSVAIGHRLGSSPRTVDKHLERTYRKLDATDRVTAIRAAVERGLVNCWAEQEPRLHP